MTQRISITGIDGTGKTTIVRRLAAAGHEGAIRAFRAPQYHEDPDLPFGALSEAIDRMSVLGDRRGDPLLKTVALFLSMTLYGDVERHLAAAYAPRWLVGERQCLADSLTYARFYFPMLQGNLDQAAIEPVLRAELGPDGLERVLAWHRVVLGRVIEVEHQPFWALPEVIKAIFSAPAEALVPRLEALYHASPPDRIILLTVTPEALADRLAAKRGGEGPPQELHEQAHVLAMFQAGLRESCEVLRRIKPDLRLDVIDTSAQTPAETEDVVTALIRGGE